MGSISERYHELAQEAINRTPRGEKAEKIRTSVRKIVKEVKEPQVVVSVLFRLVKEDLGDENLTRPNFISIIKKMYKAEKNAQGIVIADVTEERVKTVKG